jgi:hypothetical protein
MTWENLLGAGGLILETFAVYVGLVNAQVWQERPNSSVWNLVFAPKCSKWLSKRILSPQSSIICLFLGAAMQLIAMFLCG